MIVLKSAREIERMRDAGRVVAEALQLASQAVKPGVTTREIDALIDGVFARHKAEPLFKGVPGKVPFPAASCISVNEEIVHGIPGDRQLSAGDLISIDTGCRLAGWCADSAWTFPVGEVDDLKSRLLASGENVLKLAIELCGQKKKWSEIANAMARQVRRDGFSSVEQFVGHGIGREMHEDPQVPNYASPTLKNHDFRLETGLVLAIEPMVNAGGKEAHVDRKDHWTVRTNDGEPSVHFEHTVAMTPDGPRILTAWS